MTIHPKGIINKPEPITKNFNPIRAKDAREATEAYIQSKNEEQLKSIFDQIAAQVTKATTLLISMNQLLLKILQF